MSNDQGPSTRDFLVWGVLKDWMASDEGVRVGYLPYKGGNASWRAAAAHTQYGTGRFGMLGRQEGPCCRHASFVVTFCPSLPLGRRDEALCLPIGLGGTPRPPSRVAVTADGGVCCQLVMCAA